MWNLLFRNHIDFVNRRMIVDSASIVVSKNFFLGKTSFFSFLSLFLSRLNSVPSPELHKLQSSLNNVHFASKGQFCNQPCTHESEFVEVCDDKGGVLYHCLIVPGRGFPASVYTRIAANCNKMATFNFLYEKLFLTQQCSDLSIDDFHLFVWTKL